MNNKDNINNLIKTITNHECTTNDCKNEIDMLNELSYKERIINHSNTRFSYLHFYLHKGKLGFLIESEELRPF
jgi:hypothetical protein